MLKPNQPLENQSKIGIHSYTAFQNLDSLGIALLSGVSEEYRELLASLVFIFLFPKILPPFHTDVRSDALLREMN